MSVSGKIPPFNEGSKKYGSAILYTLYITTGTSLRGKEEEASKKVFDLLSNINKNTDILFSYKSQVGSASYGIPLNQGDIKAIKTANDLKTMFKEW